MRELVRKTTPQVRLPGSFAYNAEEASTGTDSGDEASLKAGACMHGCIQTQETCDCTHLELMK